MTCCHIVIIIIIIVVFKVDKGVPNGSVLGALRFVLIMKNIYDGYFCVDDTFFIPLVYSVMKQRPHKRQRIHILFALKT